jgi:acetyl-CoA acetyltransferase
VEEVFVIASAATPFRRWPDRTHRDLAEAAVRALAIESKIAIDRVVFGSCAMHLFGQANIRGQSALATVVRAGLLDGAVPIVNIEGGCATGGLAFQSAFEAIRAGASQIALAVGVEKTFHPDPSKILELFSHGIDQLDVDHWRAFYARHADAAGRAFAPDPSRIVFLDVGAMQASWHTQKFGTTERQLAIIAAKNHVHGAANELAQYREAMTVDQVLADKMALSPFRRSMCAPISDGAAAVLLCGEQVLSTLPNDLRDRAVRVAGVAAAGGRYRALDEEDVSARAARAALRHARRTIDEIDLFEVHDATAFAELHAYESLGLCAVGEGGRFAETGATAQRGDRPVNLSGGLESKGHPLAATGLAMVAELHAQLLRRGGARQAERARRALFHNAGGQIGFDEALAVVGVLEKA